jgi:hypothetical protein
MDKSRNHQADPENRGRPHPDKAADTSLGARRKREAVEQGLHILVRGNQQGENRAFRERRHWDAIVLCTQNNQQPDQPCSTLMQRGYRDRDGSTPH